MFLWLNSYEKTISFDIGDFVSANKRNDGGLFAGALFAHTISEIIDIVKNGTDFYTAHTSARKLEASSLEAWDREDFVTINNMSMIFKYTEYDGKFLKEFAFELNQE